MANTDRYADLLRAIVIDAFQDMHKKCNTEERCKNRESARKFILNCWCDDYFIYPAKNMYVEWEKNHDLPHIPLTPFEYNVGNILFPTHELAYKYWNKHRELEYTHNGVVVEKSREYPVIVLDSQGRYWYKNYYRYTYRHLGEEEEYENIDVVKSWETLAYFKRKDDEVKFRKQQVIEYYRNGNRII